MVNTKIGRGYALENTLVRGVRDNPRRVSACDVLIQVRQSVRVTLEHIRSNEGGVSSRKDSKVHHSKIVSRVTSLSTTTLLYLRQCNKFK